MGGCKVTFHTYFQWSFVYKYFTVIPRSPLSHSRETFTPDCLVCPVLPCDALDVSEGEMKRYFGTFGGSFGRYRPAAADELAHVGRDPTGTASIYQDVRVVPSENAREGIDAGLGNGIRSAGWLGEIG